MSGKKTVAGLLTVILRRLLLFAVMWWWGGVVLFSFLPVPFSTVMLEKQIAAWSSGNESYRSHSTWVGADQISPWMRLAVIAAEDQKFPSHWGFDVQSILAALHQDKNRIRGASTLTQQTAKNVFLWNGRSWLRKGMEAMITLSLELVWSKKHILTVYLNVAEFGDGIYGVEAASQHFFHRPASQLTPSQAALLAAVLPNPIKFRVKSPFSYVSQRQQWILGQMRQLGSVAFIDTHQLQ
ncbi:MAG: Biosynthetic peptidoglycan transglycosylase [Candidatus Erwinia impunctatus]